MSALELLESSLADPWRVAAIDCEGCEAPIMHEYQRDYH